MGGDLAAAEGFLEGVLVARNGGEFGGDVFEGFVHFAMVLDGLKDLCAQGGGAAIPEEGGFPGEIKEGHGVAVAGAVFDSEAELTGIGEGGFGEVA